jgi:hypothetical protein
LSTGAALPAGADARMAIFDGVEVFYNRTGHHSSLG